MAMPLMYVFPSPPSDRSPRMICRINNSRVSRYYDLFEILVRVCNNFYPTAVTETN